MLRTSFAIDVIVVVGSGGAVTVGGVVVVAVDDSLRWGDVRRPGIGA